MNTYEESPEDELVSLSQLDNIEPSEVSWVCTKCFPDTDYNVNIGQPEKHRCDICGKTYNSYKVV